ncbi:hypothetical protein V1478_010506 [Vespula squamosa]|uniref:Uncharacterized protein n=1 Tax=Vespula squamosa TaxID=30214 RepID=A0ABD2AI89_VESSQ
MKNPPLFKQLHIYAYLIFSYILISYEIQLLWITVEDIIKNGNAIEIVETDIILFCASGPQKIPYLSYSSNIIIIFVTMIIVIFISYILFMYFAKLTHTLSELPKIKNVNISVTYDRKQTSKEMFDLKMII